MDKTDIILLNIDSKNRDTEIYKDSAYFIYDFLEPIKDVISIRLASIEFPNIYYLFSDLKDNTSFKLTIGGIDYIITADTGTYTSDSMVNHLQDKLDDIVNIVPGINMKVSMSLITFRITFRADVPFTADFSNTKHVYLPFGYYLGFRKLNYTSVVDGAKFSINGESNLDVVGDNYILMRLNTFGNVYHDIPTFQRVNNEYKFFMNRRNYFAKVLVPGIKNDIIFDTGQNFVCKCFMFRQPVDFKRFEIELFDAFGQRINMNNFNFSITLEMTYIYDSAIKVRYENSLFRRPKSIEQRGQTYNYTGSYDEYDETNKSVKLETRNKGLSQQCYSFPPIANVYCSKNVDTLKPIEKKPVEKMCNDSEIDSVTNELVNQSSILKIKPMILQKKPKKESENNDSTDKTIQKIKKKYFDFDYNRK